MSETKSQQRSFRLTTSTTQLIDRIADRQLRSRNDLVERMFAEAVRLEDHPIISFRTGGDGTRRACVAARYPRDDELTDRLLFTSDT